jgi:hypothetical protein
MFKRLFPWPLYLALCFVISFPIFTEAATVEFFSPQGTSKKVRQVKARFSDQMVAFGDPRLSDPFTIECSEKGSGRWMDGKNWFYDFDKDLPSGVSCTFTIKRGIKTFSGKSMTGKAVFRFNTGGPAVIMTQPYEGDENIDEQQRFVFTLDGDPDEASLSKSVYCSIEGIKERVGIRIITGEEKTNLLKAIHHDKDKRPIIVFDCMRQFPPESRVDIIWGKGVKSKSGIATTKDQKLPFKTQSPFSATFRCLREDPKAQCMPLSRMNLDFTAPVSWNLAREIGLKNEKGQQWKPQKEDHFEATVQRVSFEGPFPEKSCFTITIPKGLKDEAGRRLVN